LKNLLLAATLLLSSVAFPSETRIRIAVVDTGLSISDTIMPYLCADGHKDFTRSSLSDTHGHGTNVAHLIAQHINPATHCLMIVKWYDSTTPDILTILYLKEAIVYAAHSNAKYINISAGGGTPLKEELDAMKHAVKKGTRVIVAAGNDGWNLDDACIYYPACYQTGSENYYTVGALDAKGEKASFSNYGHVVNAWAPGVKQDWKSGIVMSGTSQATANWTGMLAAKEAK
jgi:subtilisin family serine protease